MKKFFGEFKKFITRGNVVDMAVGVIIGGAFTAIVTALTNNIFMPIINWILFAITGGKGFENIYTFLQTTYLVGEDGKIVVDATTGANVIDLTKSIYIDWGAFITAIINFILIALVLFCIVKLINSVRENADKQKGKYAPLTKEEVRSFRREGKTNAEILAIAATKKAEQEEADRLAAEEAAKNAPKTEQQLLGEIVELLKENKESNDENK